jgi:ubiquinone biosynthesis monooxygenase Coq7
MTPDRPPYLPGDPPPDADSMIRVDHAGEYGAVRSYDGQLAVTRRGRARDEIRRMAQQEKRHFATFDALLRERHVRPTALSPFWHAMGYALGAMTAMLGERAAMACTVAVEEVIDDHYRQQEERLGDTDPALAGKIREFRADELRHRDVALDYGAAEAIGYDLISAVVNIGSRLAIRLSTRL